MSDFKTYIGKVAAGESLSENEAAQAFDIMMSGEATPSQIAGFLMALRVRGETVEEITGAVRTMREKSTGVAAPADAIDIVGTGGDAKGTYNISTCTALVVAGGGVPVAKHGNRSVSSKSGAADVLEALGVNLDVTPEKVAECVAGANVGFMFAPAHHAAMKHVMPSRKELATRTIFNLLGPLTNPAGTKRQLLGVFSKDWVVPIAEVMGNLGAKHVWVVHGADGMDELTTTGASYVAVLKDGNVTTRTVTPEDAGLPVAEPKDLVGGGPQENAEAIVGVLNGETGPLRDIILLNAAAGFIVAGKSDRVMDGAAQAAESIDSGAAKACLDKLVELTNS